LLTHLEIYAFVSQVKRMIFACEVDGGDSGNHHAREGGDGQRRGIELPAAFSECLRTIRDNQALSEGIFEGEGQL
jgi:hypothetical protein